MQIKTVLSLVAVVMVALGAWYVESLREANISLKKELKAKNDDIKALNLAIDTLNSEIVKSNEILNQREIESEKVSADIGRLKREVIRKEREDETI